MWYANDREPCLLVPIGVLIRRVVDTELRHSLGIADAGFGQSSRNARGVCQKSHANPQAEKKKKQMNPKFSYFPGPFVGGPQTPKSGPLLWTANRGHYRGPEAWTANVDR